MYESFFQLTCRPFGIAPNAEAIFWTSGHRNAFSVIEVGLDRLSQVTVLTGDIGTGKTTLIRHLLQTSSSAFSVGLLSNFAGKRGDLLPWILSAFGLDTSSASDALMFRRLESFLKRELGQGRRSVLIIDEAQNLSRQDLENLRLLSNLNADKVLMMLVLVGQPQLRARMMRSESRRLCQRIGADYHLEPLTQDETPSYIRHKCERAGGSTALFDAAACDEVHRISAGVPRKINVLCDLALISAYADGVSAVDHDVVRSVMEDARRHSTYTSLTEHDIVAVAESTIAAGAASGPASPMPLRPTIEPIAGPPTGSPIGSPDGALIGPLICTTDAPATAPAVIVPARDPMHRLALVLEAGGGPARAASGEADAAVSGPVPSNSAGSVAVAEYAPTAPVRASAEVTTHEPAAIDAPPPSAADGSRREPLQRLTRLIGTAGGGSARSAAAAAGRARPTPTEPAPVGATPAPATPARATPVLATQIGATRVGAARINAARLESTVARAAGSAARAAASERASSAPDRAGDLNALFNFAWSDDTLLFVDDPAERDGPTEGDGRSANGVETGRASSGATFLPAGKPAVQGSTTPRRPAAQDALPDPDRKEDVSPGARSTAPDGSNRRPLVSTADASSAQGTEVALRLAFAPQASSRRMGWRGAAGMVVLAASASMAAGIAIALLPNGSAPQEPESATGGRIEVSVISPELLSNLGPPVVPMIPDLANATVPATLPHVAAGTAWAQDASDGTDLAASPVPPANFQASSSPSDEDGGAAYTPVALSSAQRLSANEPTSAAGAMPATERAAPLPAGDVQPAPQVIGATAKDGAAIAVQPGRGETAAGRVPARPGAPALERNAGFRNPADLATAPKPAASDPSEAPAAALADLQPDGPWPDDAEAGFRHALEIAVADPRGAVIAYAQAAMLGHARAAYYLGQIYETGDGVPVDYAIARHWYEVASPGNARARSRLAALPRAERDGDLAPPLPLLARPSNDGHGDFIWTSGHGADPSSYLVEFGAGPRDDALAAYPVSGSAARLPLAKGATRWRVLALDASGRSTASDWRDLPAAAPDGPAAAAMPSLRPRRL